MATIEAKLKGRELQCTVRPVITAGSSLVDTIKIDASDAEWNWNNTVGYVRKDYVIFTSAKKNEYQVEATKNNNIYTAKFPAGYLTNAGKCYLSFCMVEGKKDENGNLTERKRIMTSTKIEVIAEPSSTTDGVYISDSDIHKNVYVDINNIKIDNTKAPYIDYINGKKYTITPIDYKLSDGSVITINSYAFLNEIIGFQNIGKIVAEDGTTQNSVMVSFADGTEQEFVVESEKGEPGKEITSIEIDDITDDSTLRNKFLITFWFNDDSKQFGEFEASRGYTIKNVELINTVKEGLYTVNNEQLVLTDGKTKLNFQVKALNGTDGRGIKNITIDEDNIRTEGNKVIYPQVITFDDDTTKTLYLSAINGIDGADGKDGSGIKEIKYNLVSVDDFGTATYNVKFTLEDNITKTAQFTSYSPIGSVSIYKSSEDEENTTYRLNISSAFTGEIIYSPTFSVPKVKGDKGDKGEQGIQGEPGKDADLSELGYELAEYTGKSNANISFSRPSNTSYKGDADIIPGETYYYRIKKAVNLKEIIINLYDIVNGSPVKIEGYTKSLFAVDDVVEYTIPANAKFIRFFCYVNSTSENSDIEIAKFDKSKWHVIFDVESLKSNLKDYIKYKFNSLTDTVNRIFRKVVCIGDSYTEGYMDHKTATNGIDYSSIKPEFAWPYFMSKITGQEYVNCGKTGATSLSTLNRLDGIEVAQAYYIGLGINDASVGNRVEVGTVADIDAENPTTFYGGIGKIIRHIHSLNSKAIIFLQTVPKKDTASQPYSNYNTAIREIVSVMATEYNVHLLDLASDRYVELYRAIEKYYGISHPKATTQEIFAEILCKITSDYIQENYDYFKDVDTIPYELSNEELTREDVTSMIESAIGSVEAVIAEANSIIGNVAELEGE